MKFNIRWITIIFGNLLLLFLIHLVNNKIASYAVHLCPFSPLIFFPVVALLPYTYGLGSVILTGLLLDTSEPVAYGSHIILFSIAYTTIYWFRFRFKAYSRRHLTLFIHACNLAVIIFISLINVHDSLFNAKYWVSVSLNVMVSHIIVSLTYNWFFELQYSMLRLSGFQGVHESKSLV